MSSNKPFIIGLTGGIGSGKSTVTNWFRHKNIPVWDADAAVHTIYKDPLDAGFQKIISYWPSVLLDGQIDRSRLREIVVASDHANELLKDTLVESLSNSRLAFMRDHMNEDIIVWDVPLLIESGLYHQVDSVMVIDVSPNIQLERIRKRNVWNDVQIVSMLSKQLSNDTRITYGNIVLHNNGTLEELFEQLESWWMNQISNSPGL